MRRKIYSKLRSLLHSTSTKNVDDLNSIYLKLEISGDIRYPCFHNKFVFGGIIKRFSTKISHVIRRALKMIKNYFQKNKLVSFLKYGTRYGPSHLFRLCEYRNNYFISSTIFEYFILF